MVEVVLSSPRVDPVLRDQLLMLAGRPLEEWSLADFQAAASLAPMLVEAGLGGQALADVYVVLGLDPSAPFDVQLGDGWTFPTREADPRSLRQRRGRCIELGNLGRTNPGAVRVQDLLLCGEPREQ